ncbi:hypothetical protein [Halarcobacter ebronensis]|uniref:C-type cytochrome biogenesis protein CcmI n=1 Tax=Halarcobacter ebronensis TaxID=1462615 RepID=A0A4V1M0G6_9BACT|nr:hypothetical protein [Halarcobacter ebronensis]QKF81604.1 hypothetical protein AEBR_1108 [Halarcobacter ebronensis]RXK05532.1 hypothetical protein CRV07_08450 [Halarcobacter ebronensis]
MENLFVYVVMFILLLGVILLLFKKSSINQKPSYLKKEEISKKYEYELLKLISTYEKDETLLKEKKLEFIKQANAELNNNIFFDESEIKALISRLASL